MSNNRAIALAWYMFYAPLEKSSHSAVIGLEIHQQEETRDSAKSCRVPAERAELGSHSTFARTFAEIHSTRTAHPFGVAADSGAPHIPPGHLSFGALVPWLMCPQACNVSRSLSVVLLPIIDCWLLVALIGGC